MQTVKHRKAEWNYSLTPCSSTPTTTCRITLGRQAVGLLLSTPSYSSLGLCRSERGVNKEEEGGTENLR